MKDKEKTQKLIDELKALAENDFEHHRISVLEKDLTEPPKVEAIDGNHQKFDGVVYNLSPKEHFRNTSFLHRVVYAYYFGEIPDGYVIHHIDRDKSNNNIENLLLVTAEEHSQIHSNDRIDARQTKNFVCEVCGKTYSAYDNGGKNRFCSMTCRKKARQHSEDNLKKVKCVICGKEFKTRKDKHTQTCSPECRVKLTLQTKSKSEITTETKICVECGKGFQANASRPNTKFCSIQCKKKHNLLKENEVRVCVICGKEFSTRKCRHTQTCSPTCQGKLHSKKHQENKVEK